MVWHFVRHPVFPEHWAERCGSDHLDTDRPSQGPNLVGLRHNWGMLRQGTSGPIKYRTIIHPSITDTSSKSIRRIWIRWLWVINSSFWYCQFQNYRTNKRGRQYTVLKPAHFHRHRNRHFRWEEIRCNHTRTTFKVHDVRKYDYVTFVWGARQAARFRTPLDVTRQKR